MRATDKTNWQGNAWYSRT